MTIRDFYAETKWCETCRAYVHYVMSVNHSYCVQCGSRVRLFSKDDSRQFETDVQKRRWKAV